MKFWPLIELLPQNTHFKFVRLAVIFGVISILAVCTSLFLSIYPAKTACGGLNCGVDFKGGVVLEVKSAKSIDVAAVRQVVAAQGLKDAQVQNFNGATGAIVRFDAPDGKNANDVAQNVKAGLTQALGPVTFGRSDVVGPKVSGELFRNGVLALGVAILLMFLYIWFRFGLQFGFGAVVALFHDVILTFGLFALSHIEFSLTTIAAILTILGYSMNDTVVVFDRLRENLRKYKKMPLRDVIDLSINETLSRTVITGLTALLALSGLALFGGEALFGFSLALIFGIAIGTYSSIYVASPVILFWGVKRGDDA